LGHRLCAEVKVLTDNPKINVNQAIIFDLDGLIIETEAIYCHIWKREFAREGLAFDMAGYQNLIGALHVVNGYRPHQILADHRNNGVTARELLLAVEHEALQTIKNEEAKPGVLQVLDQAAKRGLLLAVGSSSEQDWVHGNLKRLGIFDRFDTIVTADDVNKNAKPAPDIFLKVLENLDVAPQNAIVLEDSNNGVVASHRAGIRVIAVPNEVTLGQDFSLATAIIPSLEDLNLDAYFPAPQTTA
jgi:HAD superfamily hydrolase (TIGR01509 family)